ncbi:MAG: hypothetical protein ACRD9Y_03740 [Blastocatellia bacterium]
MKRNILVVLVLLLAVSASGLAQQSNSAEAVFDKWRQGVSADEVSKLRFALATVTRRTSDEVAEMDLWAVSQAPQVVIEVQPLYFEKLPNGEHRQERAGEITKTTIGSSDGGSNAGDKVGLKIILPVRPNTNALEVKWVGYANGKIQNSHTVQVWLLRDEPSESLTRVTAN